MILIILYFFTLLASSVTAGASHAQAGPFNIRVEVQPPDVSVVEALQGVVLVEGRTGPIPVRVDRQGHAVRLFNEKGEPACVLDISNQSGQQSCFHRALRITGVLPALPTVAAAKPFIVSGSIDQQAFALYAGLDNTEHAARCRFMLGTVSSAARRLARAACPDEPAPLMPAMEGAEFRYMRGPAAYAVRIGQASWDGTELSLTDNASSGRGPSALAASRLLRRLTWCPDIKRGLPQLTPGSALACTRRLGTVQWRDATTFVDSDEATVGLFGGSFRHYRHEIAASGAAGHRSSADFSVWSELGVPVRVRYQVMAGRGPENQAAGTEHIDTLVRVLLPSP